MKNKDFTVFILTHGRPDNVRTLTTLKKRGYTGNWFMIVDNEDKTLDRYIKNFGADRVIVFDKKEIADRTDEGNNFDNRKVIIHARNACFEIAERLGIKYFLQLDDDYTQFAFRFENAIGVEPIIKDIDRVFDVFLEFYKSTNVKSIAFSQGGDHIGGFTITKMKRKCMNSFF
jgi:hypothetical protein